MDAYEKFIKNNDDLGGNKLRYCRKCGKPLVYCKYDEKGKENPFYKDEWESRICHNCHLKLRNKGGGKHKMLRSSQKQRGG
ncbi:MAG: hypothetical protein ACOCRK_05455 [bacterium]